MKALALFILPFALLSCRNFQLERISGNPDFRPPGGYVYVFAGESPEAVGGLEEYPDGYCDHVGMPAGISLSLRLGEVPEFLSLYREAPAFQNLLLSLGVDFSGLGARINRGEYDRAIEALGRGIKRSGRPVYLRIGQGGDIPDSDYERREYREAYRRIADGIRAIAPGNTVLVWQPPVRDPEKGELSSWYPGDEYCLIYGMTVRKAADTENSAVAAMAEERDKSLMITSARPEGASFTEDDALEIWESYFVPLLNFLDRHRDRITAVVYTGRPPGSVPGTDTMFGSAPALLSRWQRVLREPGWVHRSLSEAETPEDETPEDETPEDETPE
jgi:hypothetical protein